MFGMAPTRPPLPTRAPSQSRIAVFGRQIGLLLLLGTVAADVPASRPDRPFQVGERADYDVSYGLLHAGTASLTVVGIEPIRTRDAYRFRLTFSAGTKVLIKDLRLRDTLQSWVDTASFESLRFTEDQLDVGRPRVKRYEIFPERRIYTDGGNEEQPSVANPLDDVSFLYFVRTQELAVPSTREFDQYFKPGTNPVMLKVIRRDTVEAAGKKWKTIVVQPTIKTSTVLSDGALVWISDDSTRVIVQIRTKLAARSKVPLGWITMKLRSYQQSGHPPEP